MDVIMYIRRNCENISSGVYVTTYKFRARLTVNNAVSKMTL